MNHKDETKAVNILFACTQNAVRSVIAKGLLQQKHASNIGQIASCGVIAGVPDGFAMAVMLEIDIDITDHEPVAFDSFSAADFQFVISFSHDAEQVVHNGLALIQQRCSGKFRRLYCLNHRAKIRSPAIAPCVTILLAGSTVSSLTI